MATKCLAIDAGTPIAIQSAMRDWRDALEDRTQAFAQSAIDASVVLATLPGLRNAAVFWLEVALKRSRASIDLRPLLREAGELRALFAKARATMRDRGRGRADDGARGSA